LKDVITTAKAPRAIGPYSQAIKANGFVFVSGPLPIDPASGLIVEASAAEHTRVILEHLKAILEAAGSSLGKRVKTTIYLEDLNDFAAVNEVYRLSFPSGPPARATVEVARLPKEARVEIDLIALV
jgi:2-iminobutanoate/2-iminopropanoate deaminase